ncbi:hypothetical protein D3C74_340680 [compost metagenome]
MQALECPGKGIGGTVTVLDRNVDDPHRSLLQLEGSQRQPPTADIFRQRDPGQERKHPLEMVFRANGDPGDFLIIDFVRQIPLDVVQSLVHIFQHIHR